MKKSMKQNNRSKKVLAFWLKKGWMQYVSIKSGVYMDVQNYVIELFSEFERLMDLITNMEVDIEEGVLHLTPHMEEKLREWEEISEAIDLELTILNEQYGFTEIYQTDKRYRGFDAYVYEDDVLVPGLYCKVENLNFDFPSGEDYAIYLYIDQSISLLTLYHTANSELDLDVPLGDPALEMTLLSQEDVKGLHQDFIPISTFTVNPEPLLKV